MVGYPNLCQRAHGHQWSVEPERLVAALNAAGVR